MKVITMCMECQKFFDPTSLKPIVADYYEDSTAHIKCANGHDSALLLQSQKFEILLESAVNALLDSYTIEAASSFSSAYERFFEFAVKVFCKKYKIIEVELKNTFKQVAKQSERQIGAFLFLHLVTLGCEYKLNNKIAPFRNRIIHQGYIPTPTEVMEFGGLVYKEIYSITCILKKSFSNELQNSISDSLAERKKSISAGTPIAITTATIFYSLVNSEQAPNFDDALERYKNARKVFKATFQL